MECARDLERDSVDLLYADPPFNTGEMQVTPPGAAKAGRSARAAYADSWPDMKSYIAWLRERLVAARPALKSSANVLIHCDHRACHHIRLLLDVVFGPDRFVNHLIWSYGLGGSSPRRFARKHDDILFYCIDPAKYWFEPPMVPATSRRMRGQQKKSTDVIEFEFDNADWEDPARAGKPPVAQAQDVGDVLRVPSLNNMASERTGYPTQKPVALLELLIRACCPPGGLVLDPCCGSGTTLVAALRAGRRAVGCDTSEAAVAIARQRLDAERERFTSGP
ncbi:MAG: site-specific DNA-methyltransferase [Phycisphaerales bacterium]|nr:site-specific DNA-methyltransferase [Phycisphaerales bacterium]